MILEYSRTSTVSWGESDPFGLVYYPRMTEWFNDTEHEFFANIGLAIDEMIAKDRTTFVMGEISFRFTGPAHYGSRVTTTIGLATLGAKTLRWECRICHTDSNAPIATGRATRIYAHIDNAGALSSREIPESMRATIENCQYKC